jgi:hypothetical protein
VTERSEATGNGAERAGGRRRRRWVVVAAAAGVALLLAAAGVGYVLTRPAEPGYDSPEAIAELLAERGAPCTDFSDGGDGRADQRGSCRADGQEIIIATFGSRADVEAHWRRQLETAADNESVGMVIGDRWTISGAARAYLRHAAEALDAEYRQN